MTSQTSNSALQHWLITPRDPLVARDGRPFLAGGGSRMKSLDWLMPSVLAGSFRSLYGTQQGSDFATDAAELMNIESAGPLPVVGNELYFPAPANCAARLDATGRLCYERLAPGKDGAMVITTLEAEEPVPTWWSRANLERWLTRRAVTLPAPRQHPPGGYLRQLARDPRNHVRMDDALRKGKDEMLFETVGLDMSLPASHEVVRLAARTAAPKSVQASLHTLGGERRTVHWGVGCKPLWECPDAIKTALTGAERVCMVLATPAWFSSGGFPVEHGSEWTPPGCLTGPKLKFAGACLDRWVAVSGWAMRPVNGALAGPKPLRRLAPAGSVYFFTCKKGDGEILATRWLQIVSDDANGGQLRRDGFGLALWGVW